MDDLAGLIEWTPVEHGLAEISSAAKGEPAWPPLALFKALLLSVWHDLSDARLAEALVGRGLDKVLFDAITAQLKAKAIRVKTGTLVDTTIIASAGDGETPLQGSESKSGGP